MKVKAIVASLDVSPEVTVPDAMVMVGAVVSKVYACVVAVPTLPASSVILMWIALVPDRVIEVLRDVVVTSDVLVVQLDPASTDTSRTSSLSMAADSVAVRV